MTEDKHLNRRMQTKVDNGEAIDLSGYERNQEGDYLLESFDFEPDVDYCDLSLGNWIWSIGKHEQTGEIRASTTTKFMDYPEFICIWLR